jgi:chromate transport protein ChrA
MTRNFWDGFGQGLIYFGLAYSYADYSHSPLRTNVGLGFDIILVAIVIRQLGLRFAPQGDKGFVSSPVIAGIIFTILAFPE